MKTTLQDRRREIFLTVNELSGLRKWKALDSLLAEQDWKKEDKVVLLTWLAACNPLPIEHLPNFFALRTCLFNRYSREEGVEIAKTTMEFLYT